MATLATTGPRLATVVSYCSQERAFIDALLRGALAFSDLVVVSVGERLYSGLAEDESEVARVARTYPTVKVVRYPVRDPELGAPIQLHNRARQAGVRAAAEQLGEGAFWALLLDGDEVPDGPRVAAWWTANAARLQLRPDVAHKLLNHWLFLHPRLVAEPLEDSVLLVHASQLTPAALSHPYERDGILAERGAAAGLQVARRVGDAAGQPMFWHYSWVREGREALRAKVATWGHRSDRADWGRLVDEAYDALDRGAWPTHDFVHGYRLRVLAPDEGPDVRLGTGGGCSSARSP